MRVKASLHLHSGDDRVEGELFDYDTFALIDRAAAAGLAVLALTCHRNYVVRSEHLEYAQAKGVLLLPGVELELREQGRRCDVLAINCPPQTDQVKNFAELAELKRQYPEMLLIAPHPNFGFGASMGLAILKQWLDLFDAVEQSWFYAPGFDLNQAALALARQANKPIVATADLHYFNAACLLTNYCWLEVEELQAAAVTAAVRAGRIENVSRPQTWPSLLLAAWRVFWDGKLLLWRKWQRSKSV